MRPLVVIPTYNERENLSRLIPAILGEDAGLHVLVVDDGSPDGTGASVLELQGKECAGRLFLKTRPGKLGLGGAYVDGFRWGIANGYDFLVEMDGDWSHHPRYLGVMLQLAKEADFVIGSRYVPGGGILNWGIGRRMLSRLGSLYSRAILGVPIADFTGGFNGWWAEALRKIRLDTLRSNGYSFQIELKYRAHKLGFRHAEFPIIFDERRAGRSKMSGSIALEALWRVWGLRFFGVRSLRSAGPPSRSAEANAERNDIRHAG
ncbi:MAG: polyprenol monophosphomannose synthase [Acidobacteria bacterium]|nr:polyprenol monophosphomannose synthase [Acidobacteriota bacterium]